MGSHYPISGQTIIYASSDGDITPNDVSKTILDYQALNPDDKVNIIGHSLGGANALKVVRNKRIRKENRNNR